MKGLLLRPADRAAALAAGLLRGGWSKGEAAGGLRGCCEAAEGLLRLAVEGRGPLLRSVVDCAGLLAEGAAGAPAAWRGAAGKALLALLQKGGPSDPVAPRLLAAAGSALQGTTAVPALEEAGRAVAACLRAADGLALPPVTAAGGAGSGAAGASWARGARLAAAAVDFACEVFSADGRVVSGAFGRSGLADALGQALGAAGEGKGKGEGGAAGLALTAPAGGTPAAEAAEAVAPWVLSQVEAAVGNGPALLAFRRSEGEVPAAFGGAGGGGDGGSSGS